MRNWRRQLEEQRKKQQENNRKWAEAEYEQRRRAKEEQARFDEARAGAGRTTDRTGSDDEFRSRKNVSAAQSEPNKLFAVLSYISILFVLPYLLCRNDEFAMFHAASGYDTLRRERHCRGARLASQPWLGGHAAEDLFYS